jgi:hypothetical protein
MLGNIYLGLISSTIANIILQLSRILDRGMHLKKIWDRKFD